MNGYVFSAKDNEVPGFIVFAETPEMAYTILTHEARMREIPEYKLSILTIIIDTDKEGTTKEGWW